MKENIFLHFFVISQVFNSKTGSTHRTWISMSVCLSSIAPHKSLYSYQAAVILSSWLWRNIHGTNVIVHLIYQYEEDLKSISDLKNAVTSVGGHVLVMKSEANISCVLMGQTARILSYNFKLVNH